MWWKVDMAYADVQVHFAAAAAALAAAAAPAAAVHTYFVPCAAAAAVLLLMKQHAQCSAAQMRLLSCHFFVHRLAAVPVNLHD